MIRKASLFIFGRAGWVPTGRVDELEVGELGVDELGVGELVGR